MLSIGGSDHDFVVAVTGGGPTTVITHNLTIPEGPGGVFPVEFTKMSGSSDVFVDTVTASAFTVNHTGDATIRVKILQQLGNYPSA